mmetsp:Transcript_16812/g.35676  ORF Transcript_16812/g.35676 Transcript_16812/m.35676 type:complete len:119 (-) Transcript_16812:409-765(-)|eukprot:6183541-Pleurochrysis_carterae.AAC.3
MSRSSTLRCKLRCLLEAVARSGALSVLAERGAHAVARGQLRAGKVEGKENLWVVCGTPAWYCLCPEAVWHVCVRAYTCSNGCMSASVNAYLRAYIRAYMEDQLVWLADSEVTAVLTGR